jgi:hypothetical protein
MMKPIKVAYKYDPSPNAEERLTEILKFLLSKEKEKE